MTAHSTHGLMSTQVQLGSSVGAVLAGLTCGGLSRYAGANSLVLAQVVALLLGLPPTRFVAHVSRGSTEKTTTREDRSSQTWWTDDLVLGLGLYTILVIAVKTTRWNTATHVSSQRIPVLRRPW